MIKKFVKLVSLVLSTSLLVSSFYGCGSNSNTKSTASSQTPVIKVSTWAGAQELKEFQDIVDKLNSNTDHYKLEIQSIPANYYQKIQTMISGKQAPDLMWLSQEYIPMYAKLGALMDITDKAKDDKKINLSDYYEGPLSTAKYKDKLYGLPWISQPVVLYYNEDMFKKEGLEIPNENWNWEDFENAAKKLTKDTNNDSKVDHWGTVIDGWPPIQTWIWTYGGETIDKDGNIKINSPEAVKGLEMFSKLINVDKVSPTKEQAQNMGNSDLFKTGKIGMFFGGAGDDIEKGVDGKFKVGMSEIPHETDKSTFSWIASTVIYSGTKNKDAAYEALVDLTNAMHKWKIVPPIKSGLDMVAQNRPEKKYAMGVIEKSSKYARGFNNQEKQAEIDNAIWEEIYASILNNKKTAKQAAKDAEDKIKTIMNK